MSDDLAVTRSVSVPRRELHVSFSPSGGPGGQHANRSATRVELRFDVAASAALSASQRERVIARVGPVIRVVADDERSQARNRDLAERRFVERLRDALRVERPRAATRPTKASQRRRVEEKKRHGETKRRRRAPSVDE